MIALLTQSYIENDLPYPTDKRRLEVCDKQVRGLILELRNTSKNGTWYLRYINSAKKTAYSKLGTLETLSLADARKKATILKGQIAGGGDPQQAKRDLKKIPTLTEIFFEHWKPHASVKKKSFRYDEMMFTKRIEPLFGHLRPDQLKAYEIQRFHDSLVSVEHLSEASADHHIKHMKALVNFAIRMQLYSGQNIVSLVALKNPDNRVEHLLSMDELSRLLNVLETDKNRPVCSLVTFMILTGARWSEARLCRHDALDMTNKIWKLEASGTKSKKVSSIALSDQAIELIKAQNTLGKNDFVFVNPRSRKPFVNINKTFRKLKQAANIRSDFRIHDCRHTHASLLINSGHSLYAVQAALRHSSHAVTERYAHLAPEQKKAAADSVSISLKQAMHGS